MKLMTKIYTSFATLENITWITEHNLLPVFLIRSLERSYPYLVSYTNTMLHLRSYSPSSSLFHDWRDRKITRDEFIKKYSIELSEQSISELVKKLDTLAELSGASGIVIIEVEKDEELGHRLVLRNILNYSGLLKNSVEELNYEQGE